MYNVPRIEERTKIPMASERILVVDDEESIRDSLKALLRTQGFEIHEASDIAAATALIAGKKGEPLHPDVILLDVKLPDGNRSEERRVGKECRL